MLLPDVAPGALATHLRLLGSGTHPAAKVAKRARKYTERASGSAEVWLARLDAERRAGDDRDMRMVWAEARRQVQGPGMEEVWMWGLREEDADTKEVCEVRLRL